MRWFATVNPNHTAHAIAEIERCTARGADESAAVLGRALAAAGLGDDDVLVTQTGCQFPCNHAPVVTVQPDDVWYGGVDAAAARAIVHEHVVGGSPVAGHRLVRDPGGAGR